MINLPKDFLNSAYVDNVKGVIFLHFKNTANEYFTHRYFLDKAFSFEQHLERLNHAVTQEFADKQAYLLHENLTTEFVDASDQEWVPAPLPGDSIISFPQYRAHAQLASHEDSQAKPEGEDA